MRGLEIIVSIATLSITSVTKSHDPSSSSMDSSLNWSPF